MKSWHRKCRPHFGFLKGQGSYTRCRITIRPHLHHHVFSGRTSCHHPNPSLPVEISEKCNKRRWWHIPKPSSIGWRKPICCWREATLVVESVKGCKKRWGVTSPAWMWRCLKVWFSGGDTCHTNWGSQSPEDHSTCQYPWGGSYHRHGQGTSCREEVPYVPWLGEGYYIHLDLWWLLDRSPIHQEVQDWGSATGKKGWFKSLELNYWRWWPPTGNPLAYTRVRSCPASDTNSQFSGSDGMSKERSITGRAHKVSPKPLAIGVKLALGWQPWVQVTLLRMRWQGLPTWIL